MIKNNKAPIVGAGYSWQGQPVAVLEVRPSTFWWCTYDVVVSYFDKHLRQWVKLLTPWLPGSFELTCETGGPLCRA